MTDHLSPTISALEVAALDPAVIRRSGAGKAFQSVSQSSAIAVQDAVDNLRNVSTISTTAIGVAMAQFIATRNPFYLQVIEEAQDVVANATKQLGTIGTTAAQVMKSFPSE